LWLNATPPRYREAERVLERLLVGSASAEASGSDPRQTRESLREARQLLIVALAGQGQISDAERQLRQMAQGDTDESVQLLQALDDVGLSAEPAVQRALGELQLKLLETLRAARPRLSSTGRFRLDLAEARALARVGKTDQALKAFDQLRAQRPDDLDLLIAQGDLLMSLDRKETYPAAAETWRKLESLSPPTSPLWYRARYNLALTYYNLGDRARCHKLIGVTRLLYPEMGGPDLRLKFDELWRRSRPEG
jgi:tetratricopeptide (TPR) repeat protein